MGALIVVFLAVSLLEVASVRVDAASSSQTTEQREGVQQKVQNELDELAAKVRTLEVKAQKSGSKDRKQIDRDLKKLKADLHTAEAKTQKLKNASSGAWDDMKRDVDRAEDRARAAYDKLAEKVH